MAGRVEAEFFLPQYTSLADSVPEPDTASFPDILADLNKTDTKPKKDPNPSSDLTESYRMKEFLKRVMKDITDGNCDNSVSNAENLSEKELQELKDIISKLKELAAKEMNGDLTGTRLQAYINGLFKEDDVGVDQSAEDYTLNTLMKRIEDLKKLGADSNAIIAELVPLLIQLQNKTADAENTADDFTVPVVDGEISFKDSSDSMYTFSIQNFYNMMSQLEEKLNGDAQPDIPIVPEVPDVPVTPDVPEPPVEPDVPVVPDVPDVPDITDTPDVSDIPDIPDTPDVPEVPETPDASEPDDTLPETPDADDAVNDLQNNETPKNDDTEDTLKTEAEKRITQKSDELAELLSNVSVQRNTYVQNISENVAAKPVAIQVADSVSSLLRNPAEGVSEITMTLNPSNLGQLQIKILNEGGSISVTIAAQSEVTQKILEDRVSSLITSLQNINSNVEDVKVVKADESAFAGFNLNNFSSEAQTGQSQSGRQNYLSYATEITYANEITDSETTKNSGTYKGGNKLWQTA